MAAELRVLGEQPAGHGTWFALAPEQAREGPVGPAAEVWALGLILREAATLVHPIADDDEDPLAISPVRRHRPRLDREIATLIDACPAPEPDARRDLDAVLRACA